MPDILIRCPLTGLAVPTGLDTETVIFESLSLLTRLPLDCPKCGKIHRWVPKDAWVQQAVEPTRH